MRYTLLLLGLSILIISSCDTQEISNKAKPSIYSDTLIRIVSLPYDLSIDSAFVMHQEVPFFIREEWLVPDSIFPGKGKTTSEIPDGMMERNYFIGKIPLKDSSLMLLVASVLSASESPSVPVSIQYYAVGITRSGTFADAQRIGLLASGGNGVSHSTINESGMIRQFVPEYLEDSDTSFMDKLFSIEGMPVTKIQDTRPIKLRSNGTFEALDQERSIVHVVKTSPGETFEDVVNRVMPETLGVNKRVYSGKNKSEMVNKAVFTFSEDMKRVLALFPLDSASNYLACTKVRPEADSLLSFSEVFAVPNSDRNAIVVVMARNNGKKNRGGYYYEIYEYDPCNNPGRLVLREDISDWVMGMQGTAKAREFILDKLSKRM